MTAWPPLDRDRFAKCRALMERGATPGERAAGRAAAARIAAAAGLTLAQADALDAPRPRPASAPSYAWRATKTSPESKAPPEPVTVEELRVQKGAAEARRRKTAEREARRLRAVHAEQERQSAAIRAAQAERDRAWADARAGGTAMGPPLG